MFAATRSPSTVKIQLWIEFLILFVGAPLAMMLWMPPRWVFGVLSAMILFGVLLLALTPGFLWRSLLPGRLGDHWLLTLSFIVLSALVITLLAALYAPSALLGFPRDRPELWLVVMLLYPLLSVAPQELLYRVLFFERYGALFGSVNIAILVNAAAFGFGHAFYGNWIAVGVSTLGGAAFAYAYARKHSFALACLWHALAGQLVFTIGLGRFFYHGAIPG